MATVIGFVIIFTLLVKCLNILKRRDNMCNIQILSLFLTASFFYFTTTISTIIHFLFVIILLLQIRKKIVFAAPINIYLIFLTYCCLTLTYSISLKYGIMMVLKLVLPLLCYLIGYAIVDSKEKFIKFLHLSNKYFIILAILCSEPIVSTFKPYIKIFVSWESGNTYIFVALMCIPLALYALTNKKKYLIESLIFSLPYITLIRRASIGGAVIASSIFLYFKKGFRAIIPICFGMILIIAAALYIPSIRERVFGGDKGDVSGMSTKELMSTDNISSSGRDYMWAYTIEKFYVGNEIWGCGLGSMKGFLRDNFKGETEHFEMLHNDHLHILIETGIVGIFLYSVFFITVIIKAFNVIKRKSKDYVVRISALCSLMSISSALFCMYYGNLLSELSAIGFSFLLTGIFFKLNKQ